MSMVDNSGKQKDGYAELMAHTAFHDVLNGEIYARTDLFSMILCLRTRSTNRFEILIFIFIFSTLEASKLGLSTGGLACGSNSVIVVALDQDQRCLVQTYFEKEDRFGVAMKAKINSRLLWYVVVDGIYKHQAFFSVYEHEGVLEEFSLAC